uniref:Uncharacterized protein n=1 Tax=Scleropages formosus TaxID=113540 RepID=A0A8C9WR80_SCLFO
TARSCTAPCAHQGGRVSQGRVCVCVYLKRSLTEASLMKVLDEEGEEKRDRSGTHSRKRVMYWRLQRDQLGGAEPYRSCGDMMKGLFPIGSHSKVKFYLFNKLKE